MIDLHVHTCFSDGEHTPKEIIEIAKSNGVNTIAITDHDSIGAISDAISEGKKEEVYVIPGIEITAFEEVEVHVLGYNIDFKSDKIVSYEEHIKSERMKEINRTFEYFKSIGISLTEDDVFKYRDGEIVTIWHFAMALAEKGYAIDVKMALKKFFINSWLDELTYDRISVKDAIKLIKDIGGIPVLAHPGRLDIDFDSLVMKIKEWKKIGLAGIEAIYSLNSQEENELYLNLAKEMNLGVTIGSDYHGEHVKPNIELGNGVDDGMRKYAEALLFQNILF